MSTATVTKLIGSSRTPKPRISYVYIHRTGPRTHEAYGPYVSFKRAQDMAVNFGGFVLPMTPASRAQPKKQAYVPEEKINEHR